MMLTAINVRITIATVENTLYIILYICSGPQNYNITGQSDKICCRDKHKEANDGI